MDALPLLTTSDKICINFCIPSIFWNKKVKHVDEEKAKWKKKIKKERSRRKRMGEAGGMATGQGQVWRMGSSPSPHMVLSYPIPAPPRMMGKIFLPNPRPLRPREAPPHSVKLYFLLICLLLLQIFFYYKTYFISKNILEITNKFIPSNQTNF